MLVITTLGALERRQAVSRRARQRNAQPQPEPALVSTGRVTLIEVARPLDSLQAAGEWLKQAGEEQLAGDLDTINRAIFSFRIATADPYVGPVDRHQALVARIGFGVGEEVADGAWTQARELIAPVHHQRRTKVLAPQARLAALLGDRERPLICEDLTLRARLDLDQGREREAALQVMIALDAALAELPADPTAGSVADRMGELSEQRDPVADAAQAALAGPLEQPEYETVVFVLGRIEAALRARAAAAQKLSWTIWGGSG